MRSSPRLTFFALPLLLLGLGGCSTYNYMHDSSPMLEENRANYVNEHPTGTFNDRILNGQVTKGMTRYEVLVAWGNPDFVRNRKMLPSGVVIDEMWKYREDGVSSGSSTYILTFEGDLLDHIEVDRGYSPFSTKIEEGAGDVLLLPRKTDGKSLP